MAKLDGFLATMWKKYQQVSVAHLIIMGAYTLNPLGLRYMKGISTHPEMGWVKPN